MSSERSSNFLISPELVSTHLGSSARQKAWDTDALYTACTEYSPVVLEETKRSCIASNLNRKSFVKTTYCKHGVVGICQSDSRIAQSTSQYYSVLQSLHKLLPSTTLYYKACTKHFPVLLRYLQSLHKLLPSTTVVIYKACTNYFPVLLCTTKLAQTTSQYYFCTTKLAQTTSQYSVLLCTTSLHKALPSTTLYYKACTKSFPVLLCTTKLVQSTSQYYFVLQSLHKVLPSTTLYYKACTNYFPVLSTTLYYKACTKHFPVLLCMIFSVNPVIN